MKQYLDLLDKVLNEGELKPNRTGVDTYSIFGAQLRFNLLSGFPLLTTKKVHLKSIIHELLWMINGDTNIKYLTDNGVTIWNEWADANGDLGPIYGKQWRDFGGVDQIAEVLYLLREEPQSRRIIISAWNPPELPGMALLPCHVLCQFYCSPSRLLSCQVYQRSADMFLGVPFNIASYALLTMMFAQQTGLTPYELVWTGGDVHLYVNHVQQARQQLLRTPDALPRMIIRQAPSIFDYKYEDFTLVGYNPAPAIKAEVAV